MEAGADRDLSGSKESVKSAEAEDIRSNESKWK